MDKLKKAMGILCVMVLAVVGMAACASSDEGNALPDSSEAIGQAENSGQGSKGESSQSESSGQESKGESNQAEGSEQESEGESSQEENQPAEGQENQSEENEMMEESRNVLVVYFSATGTTKALAEYAADALGADLYEIVPEEPYTSDDLNYNDGSSRTSVEMNDLESRPAISGSVEDMGQYTTVFLGYPIWWGEAPRIVNTFMESYDFSGKTVVPFCTSGGSGIGSSAKNLHSLCGDDVTWLDGARLGSSSSREDMVEWINSLGLDVEAK